jgi:peptide/nickel transport system permease protein
MLAQLSQEFIITARVKGLTERQVIWNHAFRNILVQLLTVVALAYGSLLEGAVLIETVFSWPGFGSYLTGRWRTLSALCSAGAPEHLAGAARRAG